MLKKVDVMSTFWNFCPVDWVETSKSYQMYIRGSFSFPSILFYFVLFYFIYFFMEDKLVSRV
jgi:hypothetical protein